MFRPIVPPILSLLTLPFQYSPVQRFSATSKAQQGSELDTDLVLGQRNTSSHEKPVSRLNCEVKSFDTGRTALVALVLHQIVKACGSVPIWLHCAQQPVEYVT